MWLPNACVIYHLSLVVFLHYLRIHCLTFMNVYASEKNSFYGRGVGCVDRSERAHNQCLKSWPFAFAYACSSLLVYIFINDALQQTDPRQWELLLQVITVANRRPVHALLQPAPDSGATTFSKSGVQFLGLGYCTEQNTDGIPSLVHCSLLRNGNHTLHQKSWGGMSKILGGPDPPDPPMVVSLAPDMTVNLTQIWTVGWPEAEGQQ